MRVSYCPIGRERSDHSYSPMSEAKVKQILGQVLVQSRDAKRYWKKRTEKDLPGLDWAQKITDYDKIPGKGKVAAQNLVDEITYAFIRQLENRLQLYEIIPQFPIRFRLTTHREAIRLSGKPWRDTGLLVEITCPGPIPQGKKALWPLVIDVGIQDPSKPLAKACLAIIQARKEKATFLEESERNFLEAADKVYMTILDNLPFLAQGDIDKVVMPLYLKKKAHVPGPWSQDPDTFEIKRVAGQFVPNSHWSAEEQYPNAIRLHIEDHPLHILDMSI
jgi:hypothetical protein